MLLGALCSVMSGQRRSPTANPQPSVSRPIYITHVTVIDTEAADPLRDIHNTTRISELFLGGKEFDRAALDAMLKRAEAAATNFRLP